MKYRRPLKRKGSRRRYYYWHFASGRRIMYFSWRMSADMVVRECKVTRLATTGRNCAVTTTRRRRDAGDVNSMYLARDREAMSLEKFSLNRETAPWILMARYRQPSIRGTRALSSNRACLLHRLLTSPLCCSPNNQDPLTKRLIVCTRKFSYSISFRLFCLASQKGNSNSFSRVLVLLECYFSLRLSLVL